jgi:hypothetical protein
LIIDNLKDEIKNTRQDLRQVNFDLYHVIYFLHKEFGRKGYTLYQVWDIEMYGEYMKVVIEYAINKCAVTLNIMYPGNK